jgi:hypothetical protein
MPQKRFGELIGLSQGRLSQVEAGAPESRAVSLLLDQIAIQSGLSHLTAARFSDVSSAFSAASVEPGERSSLPGASPADVESVGAFSSAVGGEP